MLDRARSFLAVSLLLVFAGCTEKKETKPVAPPADAPATVAKAEKVKRGGYLVGIGGCGDCHTPMTFDPALGMPVPQMDRMLSGHPEGAPDPTGEPGKGDQAVIGPTFTSFKLPFGTVYTANLTPDAETGLGLWSEDDFIRAMRTGKHRGAEAGRPILPPMPWMNVAQASDEDLKAMFAFLQSIPAIKNAVPEPNVPPPVIAAIQSGYDKIAAQQKAAAPPKL
ncbi:MAG: diheme cytochrome c-553 [Labilithrix sp.]|nr:diheme cytochrome c-553 [Labilithrix sp.]MCW5816996.1 diheme cytochrome c-553 [Labilithrix sp.]